MSDTKPRITPPQSFIASPLTPPSTNERAASSNKVLSVLRYFKQLQTGGYNEPSIEGIFRLDEAEFEEIERGLERDRPLSEYVTRKLRYEYEATTGLLSIRMPTSTHEVFVKTISNLIERRLDEIRQHGETEAARDFAKQIQSMGSSTIEFTDPDAKGSKYSPDASYKHRHDEYSAVIMEVAYAQGSRSLSRRADNYVQWSDGNIRLVIGLKIEYGGQSRKASLSMWRAEIVECGDGRYLETIQVLKELAFRDNMGNPIGDPHHEILAIPLRDFTSSALTEPLSDLGETITITSRCLYDALLDAEQSNSESKKKILPPDVKKRKRESTPGYQMTAADEEQYEKAERQIAKRLDAKDSDFEDVSTASTASLT